MPDWFAANAPKVTPSEAATGTGAAPATGDWFATNAPTAAPEQSGGEGALAASGVLGTLSAGVPVVKNLAERIATSPTIGRTANLLSKRIAPLNIGKQIYDVASGKQSVAGAAGDAALGEAGRRLMRPAASLAQRVATPIAGMSVPVMAGGLAGVAGTAGFLGALQHDANRDVQIDYSKDTPDTAIARVFSNMRDSEANRGRPLDARMDDPNDVMFRPDDTAEVTAGPAAPGVMQRLAILAGLRGGA